MVKVTFGVLSHLVRLERLFPTLERFYPKLGLFGQM